MLSLLILSLLLGCTQALPQDLLREELAKRQTYGTDTTYTTTTTTVFLNPTSASGITVTQTETVFPDVTTATRTVGLGIQTTTVFVTPGAAATVYTTTTRTTITIARPGQTPPPGDPARGQAQDSSPTGIPFDTACFPGDANQKHPGVLSVTDEQRTVLFVFAIYVLGIMVAWNLVGLKTLIYPIKMLATAYHEFWHVLVGVCLGGRLKGVDLDPADGAHTIFQDDNGAIVPQPVPTYFVAMVGNAIIGCLLVFCGFNTLASKIASFFIGLSFVAILWYASNVIILVLTALWVGLMIGLWFIEHAMYLKYYIFFIGVMTALYFAWDIMDDRIFRKINRCCPRQVELRMTVIPEGMDAITTLRASWVAGAWAGLSILLLISFILLAVFVFRQTRHGEYCQARAFLPT